MQDVRLLKLQKKMVWDVIEGNGLDPASFEMSDVDVEEFSLGGMQQYLGTKCAHKQSGFYFTFGHRYLTWSPDGTQRTSSCAKEFLWELNLLVVKQWIGHLKPEIETEDPWEQLKASKSLAEFLDDSQTADTPFSEAERQIVSDTVDRVSSEVQHRTDLQSGHLKRIADALEDIKGSTQNVHKRQFMTLLIGKAMELMLQKVDASVVIGIWNGLLQGLSVLSGTVLRLLN